MSSFLKASSGRGTELDWRRSHFASSSSCTVQTQPSPEMKRAFGRAPSRSATPTSTRTRRTARPSSTQTRSSRAAGRSERGGRTAASAAGCGTLPHLHQPSDSESVCSTSERLLIRASVILTSQVWPLLEGVRYRVLAVWGVAGGQAYAVGFQGAFCYVEVLSRGCLHIYFILVV